jgi:hypothetical protein
MPTLITVALMAVAAATPANTESKFRRSLAAKPLSFWIMSWFLFELAVLTTLSAPFSAARAGPGSGPGGARVKLPDPLRESSARRCFGDASHGRSRG